MFSAFVTHYSPSTASVACSLHLRCEAECNLSSAQGISVIGSKPPSVVDASLKSIGVAQREVASAVYSDIISVQHAVAVKGHVCRLLWFWEAR